ncbi:xylulokinase [Scopulibacillus darangshiensis]|uniref:Xylulose kinase n=1 Tax=Scopulibacillus darangshiensis TaxID=442528 RepID=A0A4R2NZQ5_9BACL|nr:xylulokinase [Scopulibacillus darangshiensis]TCP27819.1 xylulokinase [Scopulibacillus darangshiensis]
MGYIGIDLGTSGVKLIFMKKVGVAERQVTKEYPIHHPQAGWSEQDPEDWWQATAEGLRELTEGIEPADIKAIGVSGQMHGLVVVDKKGDVLTPAILWNDQRTDEECEYLNEVIGRDLLTKYTGNMALTGFTAPKILWLKKHKPEVAERAQFFMLPKDYIGYKLTGACFTDVSDASGTLYFNVKERTWSKEMLDVLGISESMLPTVHESYEIAGTVNEQAAVETGLPTGVKVAAGAGDNAAGAVGSAIIDEGTTLVSLGTSGVVFSPQEHYAVDKGNRLHSFCDASGKWHIMGVMLSAAASLKWWVEDVQHGNFDALLAEAEGAPAGSKGLYFLPYLSGERTPHNDPNARGTFAGLSPLHTRADMTRAVLEGVIFALFESVDILKQLHIPFSQVKVIGGGTKSPLWMQILADLFNVRVITAHDPGGPAIGAAILAAVGDGAYQSVQEACGTMDSTDVIYEPKESNHAIYSRMYPLFQKLYVSLKDVFNEMQAIEGKSEER